LLLDSSAEANRSPDAASQSLRYFRAVKVIVHYSRVFIGITGNRANGKNDCNAGGGFSAKLLAEFVNTFKVVCLQEGDKFVAQEPCADLELFGCLL